MIGLIPTEHLEYSANDVIRGLIAMVKPSLKERNLKINGLGDLIPIRSARAGIITAIQALNLPPNARIGVPLYCCPVVFKSIKASGCIPHFLDIDSRTFCLSADDLHKKKSNLDAVIAVHMFGNVCDINELKNAAPDKPIIEDCAQSLGSKLKGKLTGTFGDISVFSFRSGKYLSVGEGGAIYSNNLDIRSRILQRLSDMDTPTPRAEVMHIFETYLRSILRRKPVYGVIGYPLWKFYTKKINYTSQSPIAISKIYKTDLSVAKKRLYDLRAMIEAQRTNTDYYLKNLSLDSEMVCIERLDTFYNRYLFPILFSSLEARDKMANLLFKQRIEAIQPYKDIVEIAVKYYGYAGKCPVSEKISKGILVIPNNYKLTLKNIQLIVECLNNEWLKIKDIGSRN